MFGKGIYIAFLAHYIKNANADSNLSIKNHHFLQPFSF